ncbi:MAG TPA: c-type cytochrome [Puia sp.]|nr:c-type cytochrome [Puia sp.]
MRAQKQATILILLAASIVLGAASFPRASGTRATSIPEAAGTPATSTPATSPGRRYENLKILPRDISSRDLQSIMTDDFEDALGVSCGFCHAPAAGGHGLDFATDAKPEKAIARAMMRMTIGLNKKYFQIKRPRIGAATLVITCATCHKGQAFPDANEVH